MSILRPSVSFLALFTVLCGLVYPLVVTGVASVAFPGQASGSVIAGSGSELIGQSWDDPSCFWGRPSMTGPVPYAAQASTGSNAGPSNPALHEAVRGRVEALRGRGLEGRVPVDLVTASGSGLDPHVSPEGALFQVPAIARSRGVPEARLRRLVADRTEGRLLGVFGEPRVNVLLLNRDLDRLAAREEDSTR